VALIPVR